MIILKIFLKMRVDGFFNGFENKRFFVYFFQSVYHITTWYKYIILNNLNQYAVMISVSLEWMLCIDINACYKMAEKITAFWYSQHLFVCGNKLCHNRCFGCVFQKSSFISWRQAFSVKARSKAGFVVEKQDLALSYKQSKQKSI